MLFDKYFSLPDCVIYPRIYSWVNISITYYGLIVSSVLFASRLFYSPLKCVDAPSGIDEYCAMQPHLSPTKLTNEYYDKIGAQIYPGQNFDLNWLTSLPVFALFLLLLTTILRNWWRSMVEPDLLKIKTAFGGYVFDPDERSQQVIDLRDTIWKYRNSLRNGGIFSYFFLSFLTFLVILYSFYWLHFSVGCTVCHSFSPYIPRQIECARETFGFSGSSQKRYFLCTVIRADFLNLALYFYYPLSIFFSFLLFLNLLFILSLFSRFTSVITLYIIFPLSPSEAWYVARTFPVREVWFFYLLRLNMFLPIFNTVMRNLWLDHRKKIPV